MLYVLHKLKRYCPGVTSIGLLWGLSLPSQAAIDVTDKLELLGTPTQAQYETQPYARNVWDMQVYGDRLYVGSGNSSNIGPSSNAGLARIHCFDTTTQKFTDAFTTNEEQIDRIIPLNNTLFIPGHDPRGSVPPRIYRLGSDGQWSHVSLEGVHIYDIHEFNRRLWVGRGVFSYQKDALVASDTPNFLNNQPNWNYLPVASIGQSTWRLYNFFQLGQTLLASGEPFLGDDQPGFFAYFPTVNRWTQIINGKRFFPGAPAEISPTRYTIRRDAILNKTTLYIGSVTYNDHQHFPIGLYRASSLNFVRQIPLEFGFIPWDVMVKGRVAYVLSARQDAPQQFTIRVQKSPDLLNWETVLEFKRPAFARSFERINDDFYFGMGIEWRQESQAPQFTFLGSPEESGKIYRIKGTALKGTAVLPSAKQPAAR
jgi:hypothetical protein